MYDIFTLEVLEDFTITRNTYLGKFVTDYIKGDIITATHAIDEYYKKLISEGKLKLIESLLHSN